MAIRSAAIANGGVAVTPRLISSSTAPTMQLLNRTEDRRMMSTMTADTLRKMMSRTVSDYYGTSYFTDSLSICAKTGTAEVGDGIPAHAWVTGFAEDEDCPLAFSVIVEHGDSGYREAIPVASAVLQEAARCMRE